ncbi:peptide ABC transporter permease [Rhodospirillales bacterium TMPK1]|uniref:Peptide ABC transporter permease n=2 Tax=Roseiterribacter gracilis TaxID=2812848 RepID=A0A8S8XCE1_9PROT|nr:peptide ABC transporter permease [Rhodospirillales bacterium TMPK1]
MAAASFLVRRVLATFVVLIAVTILTFVISHVIPGDPAQLIAGPRAGAAEVAQLRHALGLDRPLHEQYATYVVALLHGDLGASIVTGQPVLREILDRLPATIELMGLALLLSVAVAVPLGVIAAAARPSPLDTVLRGLSTVAISTPRFWVAMLLLGLFYGALQWAPPSGRLSPGLTPHELTGLLTLDSLLRGDWRLLRDATAHLVLPVAALAIGNIGTFARIIRAAMIEVLAQDHIRTARAAGISQARILSVYALRNALLPFVTIAGLELAGLLFGSVTVESVFAWPGIGSYLLDAILDLNFPVIMGVTLFVSIGYAVINLLIDLSYRCIDPRLRAPAG